MNVLLKRVDLDGLYLASLLHCNSISMYNNDRLTILPQHRSSHPAMHGDGCDKCAMSVEILRCHFGHDRKVKFPAILSRNLTRLSSPSSLRSHHFYSQYLYDSDGLRSCLRFRLTRNVSPKVSMRSDWVLLQEMPLGRTKGRARIVTMTTGMERP